MDDVSSSIDLAPNDLSAFWMPFTANRQFKASPRMLVDAEGVHYTSKDGRKILDATSGLWCVNAGHKRPKIVEAVKRQLDKLDYAPAFQYGHPLPFQLASRLVDMLPGDLNHVFYCNSGSEAADTALKMAIAYHRARGEGTRTRFIGRERGYHGVGFGGISVGGMVANRKAFGGVLLQADHLPHTQDLSQQAFTKGQPEWGAHLADDLERLVGLHDASNIAAVIVEPVAGSTGVLVPPQGYLERLRKICDKHGILLIFDEVITGFGRLGKSFAAEYFGVLPDLMTVAKGITNATIPMGAVFARSHIHDAVMNGPEHVIELFHGYTYSGHPVACAAALATLDTYKEEDLFNRGADLAPYWQDGLHSLKDAPNVIDVRNLGLMGAVEVSPSSAGPTKRAYEIMTEMFDQGVMVRTTGDTVAMSPPLISERGHVDQIIDTLGKVLRTVH